jgi:hypothetical protein
VAGEVLGLVLALAVLEVGRLHQDDRTVRTRSLAVCAGVVDADQDRVRLLAGSRGAPVVPDVAEAIDEPDDSHRATAPSQRRVVPLLTRTVYRPIAHRVAPCCLDALRAIIDITMNSTFRRLRTALSDLVAEDRPAYKRIDASPARYDDGSWLEPRR